MNIRFNFKDNFYNYQQIDKEEIEKLTFLLTNIKGDFLNLGFDENSIKSEGLNIFNQKENSTFKIIDSIKPQGLETDLVEFEGFKVKRNFKSKFSEILVENNDNPSLNTIETSTSDSFYLGPTGGLIYDIENFNGYINIDLDMRKSEDYDKWGRNYRSYKKDQILIIEYTKIKEDKTEYKLYLGIKTVNFDYKILDKWFEKEYPYSKKRNSLSKMYINRYLEINIYDKKRIFFGSGFSENEVLEQINLLEKHQEEIINFDKEIYHDLTKDIEFLKPISQNVSVAYKLSNNAIYNFILHDKETKNKLGSVAGLPWFNQVWTRDELVGIRAFINNSEYNLVKERLYFYINNIDKETGLLNRLNIKGSLSSADGVFWLAKRIGDFIFHLTEKNHLNEIFTREELKDIYNKLYSSFNKIATNYWDLNKELLKVKNGDSWMDTIEVDFPIDIQVQFLEFVNILEILSNILKLEENNKFAEFCFLLKNQIKNKFYSDYNLYQEAEKKQITSNIFLAYYIYPDLFTLDEWEKIIDNALLHLYNSWGSISTLSHKDKNYHENYTGENNESYHCGDSWYWINNITAIVLNDLNEKKYRKYISKIISSSTQDILKFGCIGFSSEISSSIKQKAEGSLIQLWSSSTYLEMIDKIFIKK